MQHAVVDVRVARNNGSIVRSILYSFPDKAIYIPTTFQYNDKERNKTQVWRILNLLEGPGETNP
jgi:hypothetical protein